LITVYVVQAAFAQEVDSVQLWK